MSDEMVLALGNFMTEFGHVEYVMFECINAVETRDPNEVHREFYNTTFKPKVDMLEKTFELPVYQGHKQVTNHCMRYLRQITGQRNNIVHGETFYISKAGVDKVFRVGFTRKNLAPWKDFDFKGNGENIFEVEHIQEVIDICIMLQVELDRTRQLVLQELTGSRPSYLSRSYVLG